MKLQERYFKVLNKIVVGVEQSALTTTYVEKMLSNEWYECENAEKTFNAYNYQSFKWYIKNVVLEQYIQHLEDMINELKELRAIGSIHEIKQTITKLIELKLLIGIR